MARSARRTRGSPDIWPGFVDALATLLMVIIFLLMIFVIAQFFLNEAISGRDEALVRLENQVSELAELLSLERKSNTDLRLGMSQISGELQASVAARDNLMFRLEGLSNRATEAEDKAQSLALALAALEDRERKLSLSLAESEKKQKDTFAALAVAEGKWRELDGQLSDAQAEKLRLTQALEEAYGTIEVDKEKIELQVQEVANLNLQLAALMALRDELEREVAQLAHSVEQSEETLEDERGLLIEERRISESTRAQLALLNQQMAALRSQIAQLSAVLDVAERQAEEQNVQIFSLGQRLNAALATKVQELSRYRSEFFGRLREVLGDHPGIRVVGDRFVFQSEVLFESGSAELGEEGQVQMTALAETLRETTARIPSEINWILRIDGHTDKVPIATYKYPSNWELSGARAISVVKYLMEQGIAAEHLAATGFAEYQPLDERNDEIAFRRNRRIEIKLTQR